VLDREIKYFNENKSDFAKKFGGKFILIVGTQIIGVFSSNSEAYSAAIEKKYELGNFLIAECTNKEEKPQVFNSRVLF